MWWWWLDMCCCDVGLGGLVRGAEFGRARRIIVVF